MRSVRRNANSEFTFIDLFCGAGGLSLGFRRAGFRCVCAIDSDKTAVETYKLNFQDHVIEDWITEETRLASVDVIVGGPPCQGFSSAGRRCSDDRRNSLVRVFAELVARHRPKAFVFENVEGFLTTGNGERILDLLIPLVQVGYRIHLRKVNAANYGVPQHRKRVIAIGALGWDPTYPEATYMAFGAPGAANVFRHLARCPTLQDALAGLPQPTPEPPGIPQGHYVRRISELDSRRIELLKPGQSMKDLPEALWHSSYRRRACRRVKDGTPTERRGGAPFGLRRLYGDQPSKAITSGAISEFVHPVQDRFLTLRECARVQTWPDDFVFVGAATKVILQIGNAVPPLLAQSVALSLGDDLRANRGRSAVTKGALLSFVPTNSSGTSPVLQRVCELIDERFFVHRSIAGEQLSLWP